VLTFVPLLIMAFWIGLYPKPFFQILEQPVNQLVQNVHNPQVGGAVNAALPMVQPALPTAGQPEMTAAPVATTASVSNPPAAAQSTRGKN
jgi:NADH-quinone oxidoreductase subunit M